YWAGGVGGVGQRSRTGPVANSPREGARKGISVEGDTGGPLYPSWTVHTEHQRYLSFCRSTRGKSQPPVVSTFSRLARVLVRGAMISPRPCVTAGSPPPGRAGNIARRGANT